MNEATQSSAQRLGSPANGGLDGAGDGGEAAFTLRLAAGALRGCAYRRARRWRRRPHEVLVDAEVLRRRAVATHLVCALVSGWQHQIVTGRAAPVVRVGGHHQAIGRTNW